MAKYLGDAELQKRLFAEFGFPPDGFALRTIEISRWGHEYRFGIGHWDDTKIIRCYMIFEDVRKVHWESVNEETDERDVELDVIGLHLGEPDHRIPAIIHTDVFEIILTYGRFRLVAA